MVRKEIDEMARYRATATRRGMGRKGRRKHDAPDKFFALGWILEFLFLFALGVWFLSSCARYL